MEIDKEKSIEEVGTVNEERATTDNDFGRSGAFTGDTKQKQNRGQFSQGRPIRKYANSKYNKADVPPPYPNTIYNAVAHNSKTVGFSRKDLRRVSNIIKTKHSEKFNGVEPEKIEQIEDGKTFQVYCYPEVMRKDIRNIVAWYFRVKKEKGVKHERTVKLETLEKMKRESSPDYEMALVRFNMAEEERRKKEKLAQAEQAKKEKLKTRYKSAGQKNFGNNQNRQPYNKDKQFSNNSHRPYNKEGYVNRNNNTSNTNKYQPRPYNASVPSQVEAPPAVVPTPTPVPVAPPVEETAHTQPPKLGLVDKLLNKIKGSIE